MNLYKQKSYLVYFSSSHSQLPEVQILDFLLDVVFHIRFRFFVHLWLLFLTLTACPLIGGMLEIAMLFGALSC